MGFLIPDDWNNTLSHTTCLLLVEFGTTTLQPIFTYSFQDWFKESVGFRFIDWKIYWTKIISNALESFKVQHWWMSLQSKCDNLSIRFYNKHIFFFFVSAGKLILCYHIVLQKSTIPNRNRHTSINIKKMFLAFCQLTTNPPHPNRIRYEKKTRKKKEIFPPFILLAHLLREYIIHY